MYSFYLYLISKVFSCFSNTHSTITHSFKSFLIAFLSIFIVVLTTSLLYSSSIKSSSVTTKLQGLVFILTSTQLASNLSIQALSKISNH